MINKNKHAYLIMAHNNFSILKVLLKLLDDPRNDIYIHLDKKVKEFDYDEFKSQCVCSSVIFIEKRIDVRWGTNRQIDAEMLLFAEAYSHGSYDYYHLLSGVDLPVKTQDEIHSFFRKRSENFIYFAKSVSSGEYERVSLFHIPIKGKVSQICERYLRMIQELLKVNRFRKWERAGYTFEKGPNWVSLTNEAVGALIREKNTIFKMTRLSHCADEVYKQIVLKKAGVPIYSDQEGEGNSLRFVDWSRGDGNHPYTFRLCDYDRIIGSNKLFARKFDQDTDFEIVKAIYHKLTTKE